MMDILYDKQHHSYDKQETWYNPTQLMLSIPRALLTRSDNPEVVGSMYRRKNGVIPEQITTKQLGIWYLTLHKYKYPPGPYPDSHHHSSHGSSCWPVWTVHKNPTDIKANFVARLSVFHDATPVYIKGDTLEEIRAQLPDKLKKWDRWATDHKTIVESWG